ncbi:MAG: hypothetical protein QG556_924 [Pseudomonadota bacterium]|nr:hypothetical protein [Pseudomonadota bacterium]
MIYPQIKGLEDKKFRRLIGVKRSTFEKMITHVTHGHINKPWILIPSSRFD